MNCTMINIRKFKVFKIVELIIISSISLLTSIFGFIIDLNERIPDLKSNILETLMMAGVIFILISFLYLPCKILLSIFQKVK